MTGTTTTKDLLFEDPSTPSHAEIEQQHANRMLALGGLLSMYRTRFQLSVEQAAVRAGIGHMTWRRAEDGSPVRRKTYATIDKVFNLQLGSVQRALNDDALMVELIVKLAEIDPTDPLRTKGYTAPAFVEVFGRQTASPRGQRVGGHLRGGTWVHGHVRTDARPVQEQLPITTTAALQALADTVPPQPTDLQLATQLMERLHERPQTELIQEALRSLAAAVPDLIGQAVRAGAAQHVAERSLDEPEHVAVAG